MQNPNKNIKLIVFDVDGTLVDDNKEVKRKTVSVIHRLQEMGINIGLATGKTYPSVENLLNLLNIKVPLILANGAVIQWPNRELVECKFLFIEVIKEITLSNTKFKADLALYTPNHIFVEKETFNTDHMKCIFKERIEAIGNWASIQEYFPQICKAVWVNRLDIPMIKGLSNHLRENYGGLISLSSAAPNSIEAMADGVSKESGLIKLIEHLQISMDSVMVFGDQLNDCGIIESAGIGVAVGNAIDEVKSVADYVIGTNNEEAPAFFLEEYFNLK